MFKQILVAIDINQRQNNPQLLKRAVALSADRGAAIHLLHVVAEIPVHMAAQIPADVYQQSLESSQAEMDRLVSSLETDISTDTAIRSGKPWREIVQAASELQADLIVIGAHDISMVDILLGSVANQVARHAPCDVYLHRPEPAGA